MIYQVGPYPPPLGGISVHLSRLKDHMDHRGIPNACLNTFRTFSLKRRIFPTRMMWLEPLMGILGSGSIMHYQVGGYENRLSIASIAAKQKDKTHILTFHGDTLRFLREYKELAEEALRSFDALICVKPGDAEALHAMGFDDRVRYITPFIPPADSELAIASADTRQFVSQHKHILCANASAICSYKGEDLYGLDLCLDLMQRLVEQRRDLGLVFYYSSVSDKEILASQLHRLKTPELAGHCHIVFSRDPLYPVIRESSLFLRPTNTDGEPLSIREALHFGVPVLASDVVRRPEGCVLFRNRDTEDLCLKTLELLDSLEANKARVRALPSQSGLEELLELYADLADRDSNQ